MTPEREAALRFLLEKPAEYGNMLGYSLLTDLHNGWIRRFLTARGDMTLQAHRGSYKTTAVGVALTELLILCPTVNIMFIRKTDTDVKPVLKEVRKNLEHPVTRALYRQLTGKRLALPVKTATEITTSAYRGVSGNAQLLGIGTKSSITGKHADIIFTDDIVNLEDRKSRAEREATIAFYHELRNIKNRNRWSRIVNTGTPWHRDDAFTVMPSPLRFDCYTTGLMTRAQVEEIRGEMPPSLFAANYELKHIASEKALFTEAPRYTADATVLRDGVAHIDAAYGGEDGTAFTCARRRGDTIYIYGKLWQRHVDAVLDEAIAEAQRLMCGPIHCESNADKGFLAREITAKGAQAATYFEWENKYIKIAQNLRKWWKKIVFVEGTDAEYIDQIIDYTEDAEHDDAPDSAATVIRYLDGLKG